MDRSRRSFFGRTQLILWPFSGKVAEREQETRFEIERITSETVRVKSTYLTRLLYTRWKNSLQLTQSPSKERLFDAIRCIGHRPSLAFQEILDREGGRDVGASPVNRNGALT